MKKDIIPSIATYLRTYNYSLDQEANMTENNTSRHRAIVKDINKLLGEFTGRCNKLQWRRACEASWKCIFKVASEDRVGFKTGQRDDMCYARDWGLYPRDNRVPLEVLW